VVSTWALLSLLLAAQAPADAEPTDAGDEASAAAPAPALSNEELAAEVRRLVRELDAVELAAREAAEQQLVDLGGAALPHLPEPSDRMSAEVKERLSRVREKLQHLASAAVVEPTSVTLKTSGEPLSKVFEAIAAQTGNKLQDYRTELGQDARDPKLTLDLEAVPFWAAVDKILDESDSTIYAYADDLTDALAVVDRPLEERPRLGRPAGYAGPLRLEATRVSAEIDPRQEMGGYLELELQALWEPRLRPISFQHYIGEIEALDEDGQAIAVQSEDSALEVTVQSGEHAKDLRIPLALAGNTSERIATLKGRLVALLPGQVETFVFDDFKKANQSLRKANVTVTLESVRRNNEVWSVRVRVKYDDAAGALESYLDWVYSNVAYLEDPSGKRIDFDGSETTRRTENEAGMAYVFGIEGSVKGYKFVYETPSVIVPLDIAYELKDIPLP
jgi:hypothetical protein